ncbi:Phosphatidylinositol-Hypothetical protein clathrin assembly protein [Nesidiocoris tenuis]|uniref:Uncharacterized protein n=1 Tax=Nesidiocoris tenuis TaxID=355587 RepID=A0ABN7AND9_9HEMI|nr:Phosphatidylinositol-Hypothetical protein clathrin assembly protein [Nesidiocoris tenuis]
MAMGGGGGDSPAKSLAGGGVAPPPPRPPPPRPASPPKTALDDLNESIRMAMGGGGSPSKQATAPTIPGQMMPGQMAQQPMPNPQYPPGVMPCPQIPPGGQVPAAAAGYYGSSPSKVPMAAMQAGAEPSTGKVLTGDLDSSLALLAENLTINKGGQQAQKGMQWNSPKNTAKPGGTANWTPQPMAATTGANYRPMGQGMMGSPMFTNVHQMGGMMPGAGVGSPRQVPPATAQPPPQELDPFGAL